MTQLIAAAVIDAPTDTLLRSQGFAASSFTVVVAGSFWELVLDADVMADNFARQTIASTNVLDEAGISPLIRGANLDLFINGVPGRTAIFSVTPSTGFLLALTGPLAVIYVSVFRLFREPG